MKKTLIITLVLLIASAGLYMAFFKAKPVNKANKLPGGELASNPAPNPMAAAAVAANPGDTARPSSAAGYSSQDAVGTGGYRVQMFTKKEDPNQWRYGQMPDRVDRGDRRHTSWLLSRF